MTITGIAEYAVQIIGEQQEEAKPVVCQSCVHESDQMTIANFGYQCPGCESRICIMCGCTDRCQCLGGCSWLNPGICSSHREELQEMAARVFGGLK